MDRSNHQSRSAATRQPRTMTERQLQHWACHWHHDKAHETATKPSGRPGALLLLKPAVGFTWQLSFWWGTITGGES